MEWKPTKYVATCCGSIIWSERPGQFKSCQCGKSFVEEIEDYVRLGGTVERYIEDTERGLE